MGVLWVFLGSSLVLPWSLTRGGLGRYKGREILIKVLFLGKVPEYNSGIIYKDCICESRCCERRAQYGLGRRNMLKHANGVSEQRIFSPTRGTSELLKKRLFEFPRKGLFLDSGETAYTKRAARLCGSFAYTRASVFLVQLLFVPIGAEHAQVAAVAPLSVLASGSEELGCLLRVLLSH